MHSIHSSSDNWLVFDEKVARNFQIRPGYALQALDHLNREIASISQEARIADIGAGTGIFTRQLAEFITNAAVVVGIEPSEGMRKVAAQQPSRIPIEYSPGSAEQLPIVELPYDAVTAAMAAHRFDRPKFFNTLPGFLRPGGIVAFIDNLPRRHGSALHDQYLTLQETYVPAFRRGMNTDGKTGGYFYFDIAGEMRNHGGFYDINELEWDNDHPVDERTFSIFANSSTISLRAIDKIGEAEFNRRIKEIFSKTKERGLPTVLSYSTKLTVARIQ